MKKIRLLMGLLFCLVLATGLALAKSVTGVAILSQAQGVRQLGMGEVATGLSDDASAIHYNPAGIATIRNIEFNAMYHQNILDTRNEAVNFTYPLNRGILGKRAGIGIALLAYQGGEMEWNELNPDESVKSSEIVSAESDYQVGLCYGQEIASFSGNTYAGIMVKWIRSTLAEKYGASALGIDIGVLHKMREFGLGIALQNIGTDIKFIEAVDSLPLSLRFGGSYQRKLGEIVNVAGGLDGIKAKNDNMRWNLGGECWIKDILGIRAGYKIKDEDEVSLGASIRYKWVQLDYGYNIIDVFNNTHQIAITLRMASPGINKSR